MRRHYGAALLVSLLAVFTHVGSARAQRIELQAGQGWTSEADLDRGSAVSLSLTLPSFPLEVRADWLGASSLRFGNMCSGLVPPGADCYEPMRVRAYTALVGIDVPVRLLRSARVELVARPAAAAGLIAGQRVGVDSGRQLDSSEPLAGLGLGLDLRWRPLPDPHWVVVAGGSQLWLRSLDRAIIADGYQPYNHDLRLRTLRLGIGFAF